MDAVTSYLETFEALRRRKGWTLDTTDCAIVANTLFCVCVAVLGCAS